MTINDLWQTIVAGGTGFFLFLGLVLFFTGELVNGRVARQARMDAIEEVRKASDEQLRLLQQRYDEMQTAWRERCAEQTRERDYYRTMALQFARQAEQGLALAQDKLP